MPTLKELVDDTTDIKNDIVVCHTTLSGKLVDNNISVDPTDKMMDLINKITGIGVNNAYIQQIKVHIQTAEPTQKNKGDIWINSTNQSLKPIFSPIEPTPAQNNNLWFNTRNVICNLELDSSLDNFISGRRRNFSINLITNALNTSSTTDMIEFLKNAYSSIFITLAFAKIYTGNAWSNTDAKYWNGTDWKDINSSEIETLVPAWIADITQTQFNAQNMPNATSLATSHTYENRYIYHICGSANPTNIYRYDGVNNNWNNETTNVTSRNNHSSALHNKQIYVIGGLSGLSTITSHECFDIDTKVVTTKASLLQARAGMACGVVGDTIYIAGGRTDISSSSSNAYCASYDIVGNVWTTKNAGSYVRNNSAYFTYNNKLHLVAGSGTTQSGTSSHISYDTISDTWSLVANTSGMPNTYSGTATRVGDKAYYFGGTNSIGGYTFVYECDLLTGTWKVLNVNLTQVRISATASPITFTDPNTWKKYAVSFVMGGQDDTTLSTNTVECFSFEIV